MTKSENLGNLIGMSAEWVENNIDKGMWDILIELNKKNYFTQFSCEGHLHEGGEVTPKGAWEGYLVFKEAYPFSQYPVRYMKVNKRRTAFYWGGIGEESRQKFLNDILEWARCLPTREVKKTIWYTLIAKHKTRPNGSYKVLSHTTNYEEIKCILAGASMDKYTDVQLIEKEV